MFYDCAPWKRAVLPYLNSSGVEFGQMVSILRKKQGQLRETAPVMFLKLFIILGIGQLGTGKTSFCQM